MSELPVQRHDFRADTRRHHSKTKLRSKIRHMLGVATGMFPLMALFVYLMSLFRLPVERTPYYTLALVFVGCGMASLLFYALARAEHQRRHEISNRNREQRHREQAEALRREREAIAARKAEAGATLPKGV